MEGQCGNNHDDSFYGCPVTAQINNSIIVKNKKGVVFVSAIVFSTLMITMAVAMSNILLQDVHMIKRLKHSTQAQYIAETGINIALAALADYFDLSIFPLTGSIGNDTYVVNAKIEKDAETEQEARVLLTSVGSVPRGTRSTKTISRIVGVEIERKALPSSMNHAISGGWWLSIVSRNDSQISINGSMHSNLNAIVSTLNGTVKVSDTITTSAPWKVSICASPAGPIEVNDVTYTTWCHLPDCQGGIIEFPQFDYNYYKELSQQASCDYYKGNVTFENVTLKPKNGIIYVDGDVIFSGICELYGGIIAHNITVSTGARFSQYPSGDINVIVCRKDRFETYGGFLHIEEALIFSNRDCSLVKMADTSEITGVLTTYGWQNLQVLDGNSITFTHKYPRVNFGPNVSSFKAVRWNR